VPQRANFNRRRRSIRAELSKDSSISPRGSTSESLDALPQSADVAGDASRVGGRVSIEARFVYKLQSPCEFTRSRRMSVIAHRVERLCSASRSVPTFASLPSAAEAMRLLSVPGWSKFVGKAVPSKSKPADGRRQPKRRQSIKSAHFGERLLFTFCSSSATIGECRTFRRFPKRTSKPVGPRQGPIGLRGGLEHDKRMALGCGARGHQAPP